jgi:N-formylglutamate deformylase
LSDIYTLRRGKSPLLVSMPHSGEDLGPYADRMTEAAHKKTDTDWHLPQLYDFLDDLGATVLIANHSRYVIDLNRDPSGKSLYPGQNVTELCPTTTFEEDPIYQEGKALSAAEVQTRVDTYWRPYHNAITGELARLKGEHGYALLWDAHSIASEVPRFFKGRLPDFNLGTNEGASCGVGLGDALLDAASGFSEYSAVLNGRFKGGFITRRYGDPDQDIHAVQLELSQITYMDESHPFAFRPEAAENVREPIKAMLQALLAYLSNL